MTGANGQLGRAVVERLLDRVPAEEVGVSVRDPATGETAVRLNGAAIDAARAVGAGRILYTSHMGSNPASPFPPMRTHALIEDVLRESGVPVTALRNGFYASSAAMLLGDALATGELVAPADGPVAWTAHADLAEVAAVALTGEALDGLALDGLTPSLTASEAIDMAGVAVIAAELTGCEIRRVVVSDADFRASRLAQGVPEFAVEMALGLFLASRQGEFAPADPTLARLIGRPPTPLRDVLEHALAPSH